MTAPPLLFETMAFTVETNPVKFLGRTREQPDWADLQHRYSTYDEAEAGHKAVCEEIMGWIDKAADMMPTAFASPVGSGTES